MFKKRNYRKRVTKAPVKRAGGRKSSFVSAPVKKYIKRAIHANVENKRAFSNQSYAVGNINNSSTLYVRPLTPNSGGLLTIDQGTGQGNRIGNKCKTLKAMLRYTLFSLPYDAVSNPLPVPSEVMIVMGFVKSAPASTPNAGQVALLFQGGSSALAPQGDLGDLILPYNSDVWTIKKVIRHKIGSSSVEGTGSQPSRQFFANNDFKYNAVRALDITSIYPKNLVFSDTVQQIQNAGLYIMIQAVNANGTISNAATTSVFFDYCIDLTFEDA